MAGMYCICHYEKFSITDVGKFERRMKKWCKEECMPGKSMLIFDYMSLKVGKDTQKYRDERREYYDVVLPNISFTYVRVADNAMCVICKIWENQSQRVLYNMPSTWDCTELWLCD